MGFVMHATVAAFMYSSLATPNIDTQSYGNQATNQITLWQRADY